MSDFWALWNQAEQGDTEAAHQVNVLVYQHLMRDKVDNSDGWLDRVTWDDLPHELTDYMGDLNAAASLPLPENCYIVVQTPIAPHKSYDVRAYLRDGYGTAQGIATAHSPRLSSAWVAVWLQIMTGEIAG